jgi:hypothetical protein
MASLPPLLQRFPIASGCVGLGLLLLVGLYVRSSTLDEAKAALGEKDAECVKIEKNVQNAVGIDKQVETLSAGLAKLEAKLIRAGDVGPNKQYFYDFEATSGVKLTPRPLEKSSSKIKGAVKSSAFQPSGYNLVVEGRFPQIIAFLEALERGTHHYRLVDFAVQRPGQEQSTEGSAAKVVLNINLELLASS